MACQNRATIESNHISPAQLERAREAAAYAHDTGRDFTHHLTIRWELADGGGTVQQRQQRLLICARRWLERRGVQLVSLWTVEPDKIGTGWHTHTLLHLPRNLARDFAAILPRWTNTEPLELKRARWEGSKPPKGSIACGGYADSADSPTWLLQRRYDESPRLVNYLLKAELSQPRHHGKVIGKRIGFSNTIGPAHWQPKSSLIARENPGADREPGDAG